MMRMISALGLCLVAAGVVVLKLPYLELTSGFASGAVNGKAIPVTDFVPAAFVGPTRDVFCGPVRMQVPANATASRHMASDETWGMILQMDGVRCQLLPPRFGGDEDELEAWALGPPDHGDRLSRQIAICSASSRDLSFHMSGAEVEELRRKLEVRPAFALIAETVEAVRGESIQGLLLRWHVDGTPRILFNYYSPDGQVNGSVIVFLEKDSPECAEAARALISGIQLDTSQSSSIAMSSGDDMPCP